MTTFNKSIGFVAAAALLTTLAPIGATAVPTNTALKAEQVPPHAADQILVQMKAGKDAQGIAKKLGAGTVLGLGSSTQTKLVKVPSGKAAEFVEKFNQDPDVEYAELDYIHTMNRTPNDPSYAYQWHLLKIQANLAWDIHTGTPDATVAVVDTGVSLNHPDLVNKIVPGYDFVYDDILADDENGHGTHLAGIVAASANNGIGVTGVSWGAQIMPVKVLNRSGSGYTSDIIAGIDFAAQNGADVILLALGGGASSTAFQTSINNAWAAGAVIVAAAGNVGDSTIQYPANYNNVISVAATDSADKKSTFSTYGTWVDVAAPGSSIYSTAVSGYTTMSGTSQAAAVVAGEAALLRTKNVGATNTGIVNRIFYTADAITGTGSYWKYGRVNAYKAINGF